MRSGGCSARGGDLQTFIVLIASCACSIVSTSIHSVVWGSKSWFMISILSSEVLMDASAAILKLLTYCGRNGAAGHFCSEIWIMDLQLRGGSRRLSVAARARGTQEQSLQEQMANAQTASKWCSLSAGAARRQNRVNRSYH